jgi:hypothetical protein
MLTKTRPIPTREICVDSACDALAGAVAAMTISQAARKPAAAAPKPADSVRARARKNRQASQLDMLKMRLAIFLYGHPVVNLLQVLDAIESARTVGEIKLLLDYILHSRGHAARLHQDHPDN